MNEDLKNLYDAVSAEFDIGDFESFQSNMQTPEDRQSFYNAVSDNGFDLGDYDQYESILSATQPQEEVKKKGIPSESSGEEESTDGSINVLSQEQKSKAFEAMTDQMPTTMAVGAKVLKSGYAGILNLLANANANKAMQGDMNVVTSMAGTPSITFPAPPEEERIRSMEAAVRLANEAAELPKTKSELSMEEEISQIANDPEMNDAQKFAASAISILSHPEAAGLSTVQSLASQAPYLPIAIGAAALTGGQSITANAFGMALSSATAESQLAIMDGIREAGYDMSDPEQLKKFINDKDAIRKAQMFAAKRGMAIGAVEGVFGVLGAKIAGSAIKKTARTPLQFLTETLGEGTGEASAMLASGEDFDVTQISTEMLTGSGKSMVDVGTNKVSATIREGEKTRFLGNPISRDKTRKLIENAKTPLELSMVEVDESDRSLSELYKQKQTELENGTTETGESDNGPIGNEESNGVDEQGAEPTSEDTSGETGASADQSDNTETESINNKNTANELQSDVQRSEEAGAVDAGQSNEDKQSNEGSTTDEMQDESSNAEATGDTSTTDGGKAKVDSVEEGQLTKRAKKKELLTTKLTPIKAATKTLPEVRAVKTRNNKNTAFVVKDRNSNQWMEVDEDMNYIGEPLGVEQVSAIEEINRRYSKNPDAFNPDSIYDPSSKEKAGAKRAEAYIAEAKEAEKNKSKGKLITTTETGFKFNPTGKVREWVGRILFNTRNESFKFIDQAKKAGIEISDAANFAERSQLVASQVSKKLGKIIDSVYDTNNKESLGSRSIADGTNLDEIAQYVTAKHAPEATMAIREQRTNALIELEKKAAKTDKEIERIGRSVDNLEDLSPEAKRKMTSLKATRSKQQNRIVEASKKLFERGIGLTEEEAKIFLNSLSDEKKAMLDKYENEVRENFIKPILNLKREAGIITDKEYDEQLQFKNYIAQRVKQDDQENAKTPTKTRTPRKKIFARKGSNYDWNERVNPVNQVVADYIETVNQIEKNELNKSILHLAKITGSEELDVWKPKYDKDGKMEADSRESQSIKTLIKGRPVMVHIPNEKLYKAFAENNSIGKAIYQNAIIRNYAKYKRRTSTTWNPEFIPINFLRDVPNALANLNSEFEDAGTIFTKKDKREIVGETFKSVRAIWKARRTGELVGEIAKDFGEFEDIGGVSSWGNIDNVEDSARDLQKVYDNGFKEDSKMKAGLKNIAKFVDNMNDAVELGVRLATYRYAKRKGKSPQQAAVIAKNITVNFEKKGEIGPLLNALYLFANAGLQSNKRMFETFKKNPKHAATVAGMYFSAGFAFAAINDLINDDEEEEPQKYEEETSLAMKIGKVIVKIPLAYGFNVFAYAGNQAYKLAQTAWKGDDAQRTTSVLEAASNVAEAGWTASSPVAAATFSQMISPTMTDVLVQMNENKTYANTPIANQGAYLDNVRSNNGRDNTAEFWVWFAQTMNKVGGNKAQASPIKIPYTNLGMDMEPEMWRYLWRNAGGGTRKFVERAVYNPIAGGTQFAVNAFLSDENQLDFAPEFKLSEVPFVRRGARGLNPYSDASEMYDMKDLSDSQRFTDGEMRRFKHHLDVSRDNGMISEDKYYKYQKEVIDNQLILQKAIDEGVAKKEAKEMLREEGKL